MRATRGQQSVLRQSTARGDRGRAIDLAHDEADRAAGNTIGCPLIALRGRGGIPGETGSPLDTRREWANDVQGVAIDCGHSLPKEKPQTTAAALLAFLAGRRTLHASQHEH